MNRKSFLRHLRASVTRFDFDFDTISNGRLRRGRRALSVLYRHTNSGLWSPFQVVYWCLVDSDILVDSRTAADKLDISESNYIKLSNAIHQRIPYSPELRKKIKSAVWL